MCDPCINVCGLCLRAIMYGTWQAETVAMQKLKIKVSRGPRKISSPTYSILEPLELIKKQSREVMKSW